MSSWSEGRRPLSVAILALGGEGGGVLSDWILNVAERAGYTAQNTSVAGVAQRTGATVYYVEILPPSAEAPGAGASGGARSEPVLSIFATPGEVDVVIASELMECGRAIQRGFSTADRTTLITSTNRVYSIDEKVAMGDGRVSDTELLELARKGSKRLVAADFMALAEGAGSVISASLFGALAGSGALPFDREAFEEAIRSAGKGVEPSLAAFAAGYDVAASEGTVALGTGVATTTAGVAATSKPSMKKLLPMVKPVSAAAATDDNKAQVEADRSAIAATDPASLVGPELRPLAAQVSDLPKAARSMILHGLVRAAVFQNLAYAERYLTRVTRFAAVDPQAAGDAALTHEAARHIALWMCYQDTIQVALQKTRRARMERIRGEARAKPNQLVQVREFLHPQLEEITDTMPSGLGARMARSRVFARLVRRLTHKGMILNTSSVFGYTLMAVLARLRPLRPRTLRFGREQAAIDEWIEQALGAATTDSDLAREILECQGVLKGYGATYAHGGESFEKLMVAARSLQGAPGAAARLAALRSAALADEDGVELQARLDELAAA